MVYVHIKRSINVSATNQKPDTENRNREQTDHQPRNSSVAGEVPHGEVAKLGILLQRGETDLQVKLFQYLLGYGIWYVVGGRW